MMQVSNRKAVRRLAWRSFRANRIRNTFAVIAMILTTVLFTSLYTAGVGLTNSTKELMMREYGTNSHGSLAGISREQVEQLSHHPLVKKYGTNLSLSYLREDKFAVRNAEIGFYDETSAKMSYCYPTTGSLPKKEYELATETSVLEKLGITPKLGEEVTISYPLGKASVTQTFTLCGYWDTDPITPHSKILLSEEYVEKQLLGDQSETDGKTIDSWCLQMNFDSSPDTEKDIRQIAKEEGYQVDDNTRDNYLFMDINMGYASLQRNKDYSIIYFVIAISLLILFTGYLIIYNIFLISVAGDIRFYGLLKTIGTTRKQIKRMIRYQALLLSLIGMPPGLAAGYLIGIRITPLFMSSMGKNSFQKTDPLIFIGAAAFTILTVLISIRKPGKTAARVSPIEAVRYTEGFGKGEKHTKHSKHGARIYRMALSNLFRNKKKTILVFVSLTLSIVLLNAVFSISKGFDLNKLIGKMTIADYTLASTNYFESDYRREEDEVSNDLITEAMKQMDIQEAGRIYYETKPAVVDYTRQMIENYFSGMNQTDRDNILYHIGGDDKNQWEIQLYGMDDFILNKLEVAEGSLDLEKFKSGDYMIQVVSVDDYDNPIWDNAYRRAGDKVTVNYIDEPAGGNGKLKYHSKTYEVMAVVKEGVGWNVRYYYAPAMILPSGRFTKDTGINAVMAYLMDVKDNSEAAMDQFLKSYTETVNTDMSYESKTTLINMFKKYRDAFVLVGEALSILIGIVGILNFTNVMLTGSITRKREFATLKSIGMTGKQLVTLLVIEGFFYALITILISAACCSLINLTLIKSLEGGIWFFTAQFTLLPVLVITPILLLFSTAIPYLFYRAVSRRSIVEQLRAQE